MDNPKGDDYPVKLSGGNRNRKKGSRRGAKKGSGKPEYRKTDGTRKNGRDLATIRGLRNKREDVAGKCGAHYSFKISSGKAQ